MTKVVFKNETKRISFTDERIDEVRSGEPLTDEERAFLIEDTPRFEECSRSSEELAALNDADLMTAATWVWMDYCR